MYRSIIVPVDGSARSQSALNVAAVLARESGATMDIARVHLNEREDLADDPTWDAMFREGEIRYLESLALAYGTVCKRQVGTALLDPPIAESLIEFAESRIAPLFVIAGRGRTGLRRALLGSTSDALVRRGNTPVLVLRDRGPDEPPTWRGPGRPFARVLLPLDGTTHSEGGIAHALAIAEAMGARLRIVRVVGPVVTSAVLGAYIAHPLFDEATMIRNDIAQDYLQRIVDRISVSAPKVQVTTEVALSTDPATAIIECCRRAATDLVVIPTHGRGLSRLIAGAVGDRILRDGPDAILFVKPAASRLPAGLSDATPVRMKSEPALVRG
jgi:nucleotide-binding universal stress UspA family protein